VGKITPNHERQVDDRPCFTSSSPSSYASVLQFLAISAAYSISLLNGACTVAHYRIWNGGSQSMDFTAN